MYQNIIREGDTCRTAYRDGIEAYIKRMEQEGYAARECFMQAENFLAKIEEYRADYMKMLGLDRICSDGVPAPTLTRVGEDADAVIYRRTQALTACLNHPIHKAKV